LPDRHPPDPQDPESALASKSIRIDAHSMNESIGRKVSPKTEGDSNLRRPVAKFADPNVTAGGQQRARVALGRLRTLWFNTACSPAGSAK
jgi:hypothetical protein